MYNNKMLSDINEENKFHIPVLLNESMRCLNIRKGLTYVDCTLGTGGHSLEILKRLNDSGILIGIEQDIELFEIAKERLNSFKNCFLFNANYLEIKNILRKLNLEKITGGVILDLGLNTLQISNPKRGFSFIKDGPLDMRMDLSQTLSAYEVVNNYNEKRLADIIYKYGEERHARWIAKNIIRNRPIKSTLRLAELAYYPKYRHSKIHPATRTFQAVRIEVNKELETLEKFLFIIPELLHTKSRLTVISFHSLEDRIVKHFLKERSDLLILTKKPIQCSKDEMGNNPSARSAKLRASEKL